MQYNGIGTQFCSTSLSTSTYIVQYVFFTSAGTRKHFSKHLLYRYILTVPRVPAVLEYRYYFKIRALRAPGACPLLWARIRKEFCESDQAESRAVVLMYLS